LAASQKYEVYTSVLTGSSTQQELVTKYQIDRSTIRRICQTAREGALEALARKVPGRRGPTDEQVELEQARIRIRELEKTVCEQAIRLHLHEGKDGRG
jgi:transposase-like protein